MRGFQEGILPNTAFSASDSLTFYGTVLAFVGTMVLGLIAVWQSKNANKISKQLLEISVEPYIPFIDLVATNMALFRAFDFKDMIKIGLEDYSYILFDEDKNVKDCDSYAHAFIIKNIRPNDIVDLYITDVNIRTIFSNGKSLGERHFTKVNNSVNNRIESNSWVPFVITGLPDPYGFSVDLKDEEKLIAEGYTNPTLVIEFEFELINILGKKYSQRLKISTVDLSSDDLRFPLIINKVFISNAHAAE